MQHRRRRLAVGFPLSAVVAVASWAVLSAASADTGTTAARAAAPAVVAIVASVDEAGAPILAGPWQVHHASAGEYELTFPSEVDLEIRSWEQAAGVTVRPVTDHTWVVSFAVDDVPVDTAFTFVAAPTGR